MGDAQAAKKSRSLVRLADYMACRDLILVALVIIAASASTADDIVAEGVEERAAVQEPLHVTSVSDIEKVILKLQAGKPEKVVTLPTSLLGVGWKEQIGKEFIYGNAPLHVGSKYLCWDIPSGHGDGKIKGTKCGPRNPKNRVRAALATRHGGKHHIDSVVKYLSSKFGKMTPLEKSQAKAAAKKAADHAENTTAKKITKIKATKLTKKAMSVTIRCKRVACAHKAERLSKAQARNKKFTASEKKAKVEMKEAKKDKESHTKTMEIHKKKHAKLTKLAKAKSERFGKAQEKRNAKLKKLAEKKQARVRVAQERARKLTAREATTKKEVSKAYASAKKAKNKILDAEVEEIS